MHPMDRLDEIAEIGRSLHELQKRNEKSMAQQDLSASNKLQEKIADLTKRKEELLKQAP
jgi:hypothetical protein